MSWTILSVVFAMVTQVCAGEKSCDIWSNIGPSKVVQRGHSFQVYCTFKRECKVSMQDHPSTSQRPKKLNSTTVYFDVSNITMHRTYMCKCENRIMEDPCGVDIMAGYPPDRPHNISCIYKVIDNESGVVVCTWVRGRETHLRDTPVLWVTTAPGNRSGGPVSYSVSSKRTEPPSASFTALRSVRRISVWIQVKNALGTVNSSIFNFTLRDIAAPPAPALGRPTCGSRSCTVAVEQSVRGDQVEVQRRADPETWSTCHAESDYLLQSQSLSELRVKRRHVRFVPEVGSLNATCVSDGQVVPANASWSISSLEPYRLYHFRARSKLSGGLWSAWSADASGWTQEEVPAKELDVWFTRSEANSKSLRVYWKEASTSISRGKIVEYRVGISPDSTPVSLHAGVRNYSVPHCAGCEVTVWARNSKGVSPPARITTQHTRGQIRSKSPQDVRVARRNHSVTIYWREPGTAPPPAGYVVEWYPQGHKLQELRWLRVGAGARHAVLSDILPFECYEGAVYDVYEEGSGSGTRFQAFATLESAPAAVPVVLLNGPEDENKVTVSWQELPRGQRGGCITKYTIYLEKDGRPTYNHSVEATRRTYTMTDLSPGDYSLRMSASTAKGEGPKSPKVKSFIEQKNSPAPVILFGIVTFMLFLLFCFCRISAAKRRLWECFQCSLCDVVPDPANSKWAKECSQQKGKMNLQLQLSQSSASGEEEEPILVDVEELPRRQTDLPDASALTMTSSSSQPPPRLGPGLYPLTTYIKSYSLDSDSSDHTNTSMDTTTTVDYISPHGPGNLDEEDEEDEGEEEEEEEEEGLVKMQFLPSSNIFINSLDFGPKLTLDAVKIDCSDLFSNIQCASES